MAGGAAFAMGTLLASLGEVQQQAVEQHQQQQREYAQLQESLQEQKRLLAERTNELESLREVQQQAVEQHMEQQRECAAALKECQRLQVERARERDCLRVGEEALPLLRLAAQASECAQREQISELERQLAAQASSYQWLQLNLEAEVQRRRALETSEKAPQLNEAGQDSAEQAEEDWAESVSEALIEHITAMHKQYSPVVRNPPSLQNMLEEVGTWDDLGYVDIKQRLKVRPRAAQLISSN
jgi:hypothetical protein